VIVAPEEPVVAKLAVESPVTGSLKVIVQTSFSELVGLVLPAARTIEVTSGDKEKTSPAV
jgi:hypothetical protein